MFRFGINLIQGTQGVKFIWYCPVVYNNQFLCERGRDSFFFNRMDGWMHAWMHGWMDGCMDAWMHGCMDVILLLQYFKNRKPWQH